MLLLCVFLIVLFWLVYTSFCSSTSCRDIGIDQARLTQIIQIAFPLGGVVNSLRIGTAFRLNDSDDEPETLFYASLAGLAICFNLFGLFFNEFISRAQKPTSDSLVFIVTIITFMVTAGALLADRQTWDKSTNFVKFRVSLSLIHIILILVNPLLGLLSSIIIVPTCILLDSSPKPENKV